MDEKNQKAPGSDPQSLAGSATVRRLSGKRTGVKFNSIMGAVWIALGVATVFVGNKTHALLQIGLGVVHLIIAAFKFVAGRKEAQR
ncbi:hypothetical protein ACFMBG_15710 [Leisingera sp. D0M16]|uniref:hypothetical protein n=1 Tax=Leisingera coralii TaxID=3351347 RepID=UPI003B7671F1